MVPTGLNNIKLTDMEDIIRDTVKKKPYNPGVSFKAEGKCELWGESYMEDKTSFFNPLIEWLREWSTRNAHRKLEFTIKMVYFNTGSSKALLEMLEIAAAHPGGCQVHWYLDPDDPDMEYEVEDFKIETGIDIETFELIK